MIIWPFSKMLRNIKSSFVHHEFMMNVPRKLKQSLIPFHVKLAFTGVKSKTVSHFMGYIHNELVIND